MKTAENVDTVESTKALLDRLALLTHDDAWLFGSVRCPRCRAGAGAPCRRPDGEPYTVAKIVWDGPYLTEAKVPAHHAPRIDVGLNLAHRCPTWLRLEIDAWASGETRHSTCSPAFVSRRLRKSGLYKLAVQLGRIT